MSSNNWKKVLLYGGAGTAAVAFYLWRKASSYVPEPGTGGTFDSVFQKANAAALERQLNGETNTTPIKPLFRYAPPAEGEDYAPILILYGTEYGFSAELAKKLEDEIQKLNICPKLYPRIVSMEDYEVIEWDKEQAVLVICSTYGDGVPPSKARSCFDYMMDDKRLTDLTLKHTTFSVLALGDKGYPHFCRAGKTFDARLEELGGSRFVNRGEVDLEDWDVINRWISNIIAQLPSLTLNNTKQDYLVQKLMAGGIQKKLRYDRARPFFAKLVEKKLLTVLADGEDKETIHFEFELPEEGMQYIVGDSLGVIPINLELEVDLVLKALGVDGAQSVKTPSWRYQERDDEIVPVEITLHEALLKYFDLKNPKPRLAQVLLKNSEKIAENDQIQKLKELMKDGVNSNNLALNKYLQSREVVDVLNDFSSIQLTVEEFLDSLGQLLPRYYSISSSPNHDPKKVTITVAVVRYNLFSRDRVGVCSTYLSDRIHVGDKIPIFVNNNPDFRLPSDPALPILMVGPGTGIAPFRAMLQERVKLGATGSNTLYFGCRFSNRDYLYKEELENYVKDDKLILHTAFSREQKEKIYVQQRVSQTREHVWEVLEKGGHIYICGDAQYMAGDVHNALVDVVSEYGKVDHEGAKKYLEDLELAKRYQKDTWF